MIAGAAGTGKSTLAVYWSAVAGSELDASCLARDVAGDALVESAGRSRYLVYLVDARVLCGCLGWLPQRNLDRVRHDLAALARPSSAIHGRCAVAVTHADADCRPPLLRLEYPQRADIDLSETSYVDLVTQELRLRAGLGAAPIPVVAGSLSDAESAERLVAATATALGLSVASTRR